MRRIALLIAVLMGLATSSASAATQLDFSLPASPALAKVESQIQMHYINKLYLPSPSGHIPVQVRPCPGMEQYGGCFESVTPSIFLQPLKLAEAGSGAWGVTHELGHYVDTIVNGEDWTGITPVRQEFMDLVGMKAPWLLKAPAGGPGEAWADWYAHCSLLGLVSKGPVQLNTWRSYDFKLAPTQYNRVCAFFKRVLAQNGFDAPTMGPSSIIPYNKTGDPDCAARPASYDMNALRCKWSTWSYGPHYNYQCFNLDKVCIKRIDAWNRKHYRSKQKKCNKGYTLKHGKCIKSHRRTR